MTGATMDLMKIDHEETADIFYNASAKSKLNLKEKVNLLGRHKVSLVLG